MHTAALLFAAIVVAGTLLGYVAMDAAKRPRNNFRMKRMRYDRWHLLPPERAFRLSVTALQRLERSAEALNVTSRHFARLLVVNNKTLTYTMTNQGRPLHTVKGFVLVDLQQQVHDMIAVMKRAEVRHLDCASCKNFVINDAGVISLIDFDIVVVNQDGRWVPKVYHSLLVAYGLSWDDYHLRMLQQLQQCASSNLRSQYVVDA